VVDRSRALRRGRLSHIAHRGPTRWSYPALTAEGRARQAAWAQSQQCRQRIVARPRRSRALHHLRAAERQPADPL
jgi:hypothetical protein